MYRMNGPRVRASYAYRVFVPRASHCTNALRALGEPLVAPSPPSSRPCLPHVLPCTATMLATPPLLPPQVLPCTDAMLHESVEAAVWEEELDWSAPRPGG